MLLGYNTSVKMFPSAISKCTQQLIMTPRNPCVLLPRCGTDINQDNGYTITTTTSVSSLYGKPEFSDVTLIVGDQTYKAHRLVLQTSSEVFARMFSNTWHHEENRTIHLREDEDCEGVFEVFLRYLYTGTCLLDNTSVIPVYILADKYGVSLLSDECIRIIMQALKVQVSYKIVPMIQNTNIVNQSNCDNSFPPEKVLIVAKGDNRPTCLKPQLIAQEVLSLDSVIRVLEYSSNELVIEAAKSNLFSRLATNIQDSCYTTWFNLNATLLLKIVSDDYFYCPEYKIYLAVKAWLSQADPSICSDELVVKLMSQIRYAVLSVSDLYNVSKDNFVMKHPSLQNLVQDAIEYQLFASCCDSADKSKWTGSYYTTRIMKSFNQ